MDDRFVNSGDMVNSVNCEFGGHLTQFEFQGPYLQGPYLEFGGHHTEFRISMVGSGLAYWYYLEKEERVSTPLL
ncbi:MAG TPA: hypothetical protein DCR95_07375 [Desulfobacter sp.]|nr:hypothetical protein [Desulfobacter sp.]